MKETFCSPSYATPLRSLCLMLATQLSENKPHFKGSVAAWE